MCLFEAKYIHIYPTFVDGLGSSDISGGVKKLCINLR